MTVALRVVPVVVVGLIKDADTDTDGDNRDADEDGVEGDAAERMGVSSDEASESASTEPERERDFDRALPGGCLSFDLEGDGVGLPDFGCELGGPDRSCVGRECRVCQSNERITISQRLTFGGRSESFCDPGKERFPVTDIRQSSQKTIG